MDFQTGRIEGDCQRWMWTDRDQVPSRRQGNLDRAPITARSDCVTPCRSRNEIRRRGQIADAISLLHCLRQNPDQMEAFDSLSDRVVLRYEKDARKVAAFAKAEKERGMVLMSWVTRILSSRNAIRSTASSSRPFNGSDSKSIFGSRPSSPRTMSRSRSLSARKPTFIPTAACAQFRATARAEAHRLCPQTPSILLLHGQRGIHH